MWGQNDHGSPFEIFLNISGSRSGYEDDTEKAETSILPSLLKKLSSRTYRNYEK